MKKQLIKESFVATVVTLLLTFGISFIPFQFEFLKVIRQGFHDNDIYDLFYRGKDLQNTKRDNNIVLVEVASDRASIADQINIINDQQPAVIGIDAIFEHAKDSNEDRKLIQAINGAKNIVLSSRLNESENGEFIMENNFFEPGEKQYVSGFTNFAGGRHSVIRNYAPFVQLNNEQYFSFTSRILRIFSSGNFEKLKDRHNNIEIINYSGNLENYTTLTVDELLYYESTGQLSYLFKHKIVLLGFFVKHPPLVLEDLYFSPLNEEVAGKSYPDMYGLVVHANILTMILSGKYATLASAAISYLCAGIITFFFLCFYVLKQYSKPKHPSHEKFLLIQLVIIIIVFYLFLQIYNWFLVKVSLLPVIISLVVCVELLGIYKSFALWLNKKWNYQTIFKNKHSI
jgi:CHASE2 domain-containing sensor protein